jgi:SAM-dependent methyltransferase
MRVTTGTSPASAAVERLPSAEYWELRARRYARGALGLPAVCSYGMPWLYNFAIELCQRRALAPWLRRLRHGTALDIGCGVGRWSLRLSALGMQVTGIDLSPFMIERATRRSHEAGLAATFLTGDIRSLRVEKQFDLILCVTVLQHIVDPQEAADAIANLAGHLSPGGELVLLEAAPSEEYHKCDSEVFRARGSDWYRETLIRCGLRVERVRGVDPMPLKTLLMPHYKSLPGPLRTILANATAAISLPFDWLLGPYLARHSWHKVIAARRAQAQHEP